MLKLTNMLKICNKNNSFRRSLCNLAVNNNYFNYYDNNEDLFIEKLNYDKNKKCLTITKKPYYLDENYIKNYFEKNEKLDIICENLGNKCFNCDGTGYILNKKLNYDLCKICNGNGIY